MLARNKKKSATNKLAADSRFDKPTTIDEVTNIDDYLLNPNETLPDENTYITISGKTILTERNVAVISGKPKSRKSVIAHSIISSALSNKPVLGIECNIDKHNIVLIDTEQSRHDLMRSLNRMKNLAGISNISDRLKLYSVRSLNVQQIRMMLQVICDNTNNKIVIIDGALDLINNMNDVEESKSVIDLIKRMLVNYQISFVLVIHQSKSTNFTIGHFGSYFDRFAQSVVEVSKTESGSSRIASAMMRSDADFQPYEFYWNYQTNNYAISYTESIEMLAKHPQDISNETHKRKCEMLFKKNPDHNNTTLLVALKNEYHKSEHWCKGLIKHLYDLNLITKQQNKIRYIGDIPF